MANPLSRILNPYLIGVIGIVWVRNHFAAPVLKAETWHLTLEGAVEQPLSLSYRELSAMPSTHLDCYVGVRWQSPRLPNAQGKECAEGDKSLE